MVSTRTLISKYSTLCKNHLVIILSEQIKFRVTVALIFHSCSVLKQKFGTYLSFSFLSVLLTGRQISLLLLVIIWSGRLAEIRWSVCISISKRRFCILFSSRYSWLCIYHLFVWSIVKILHNSLRTPNSHV